MQCPCQSHQLYENCCAPYHRSLAVAPTPLALMRSRYSAYVLKLEDYILGTWHPTTRPHHLEDTKLQLTNLQVVRAIPVQKEAQEGFVEFKAYYSGANLIRVCMHENSRFIKVRERWYYIDGEIQD